MRPTALQRHAPQPLVGEQVEHVCSMKRSLPISCLRVSRPTMVPMILLGASISTFSPRTCPSSWARRGLPFRFDGEAAQPLLQRVVGAVADGGDVPAVEVLHDHALQEVVDVLDLELQFHLGVVGDLSVVVEVAHAGAEQHHPFQGEIGPALLARGGSFLGPPALLGSVGPLVSRLRLLGGGLLHGRIGGFHPGRGSNVWAGRHPPVDSAASTRARPSTRCTTQNFGRLDMARTLLNVDV